MPRMFRIVCAVGLAAFQTALAFAGNPEYRCEPDTVAHDAVAVAYSDVDVAAFSDPNAGICTFAIDGAAPAGSPGERQPIAQVMDQVNQGDVEGVVIRLTLARAAVSEDAEELRERLRPVLKKHAGDLASCFEALHSYGNDEVKPVMVFENGVPAYLAVEDGPLFISCAVADPGEYENLRTEYPTLRLRAASKETERSDTLFVPLPALKREGKS